MKNKAELVELLAGRPDLKGLSDSILYIAKMRAAEEASEEVDEKIENVLDAIVNGSLAEKEKTDLLMCVRGKTLEQIREEVAKLLQLTA